MSRQARPALAIDAQNKGRVTDELYRNCAPILIKHYTSDVAYNLPYDDLLGIIACGMHRGLKKWKPEKGDYLTACYWGIGEEIHEFYRKESGPVAFPLTTGFDIKEYSRMSYSDLTNTYESIDENISDKIELVHQEVDKLEPIQQTIFELYYVKEYNIAEMQRETKISRRKLKEHLKTIMLALDYIYS